MVFKQFKVNLTISKLKKWWISTGSASKPKEKNSSSLWFFEGIFCHALGLLD